MAADLPTRDDVERGTTVEVEREQEHDDGQPIVGEVRVVITNEHTHPRGIQVELESGVVGRVKEVHPEEA